MSGSNGTRLPVIGITLGDPACIGPEILAKLLAYERLDDLCIPVVVGDVRILQRALNLIGSKCTVEVIDDFNDTWLPGQSYVYDLHNIAPQAVEYAVRSAPMPDGRRVN